MLTNVRTGHVTTATDVLTAQAIASTVPVPSATAAAKNAATTPVTDVTAPTIPLQPAAQMSATA